VASSIIGSPLSGGPGLWCTMMAITLRHWYQPLQLCLWPPQRGMRRAPRAGVEGHLSGMQGCLSAVASEAEGAMERSRGRNSKRRGDMQVGWLRRPSVTLQLLGRLGGCSYQLCLLGVLSMIILVL
jgi:hypothetical protein